MKKPTKTKKDRTVGLHEYRCAANPDEKAFADATAHCDPPMLGYLLNEPGSQYQYPLDPTDRDRCVAATVVQWLGSPVGRAFLSELGWVKKDGR